MRHITQKALALCQQRNQRHADDEAARLRLTIEPDALFQEIQRQEAAFGDVLVAMKDRLIPSPDELEYLQSQRSLGCSEVSEQNLCGVIQDITAYRLVGLYLDSGFEGDAECERMAEAAMSDAYRYIRDHTQAADDDLFLFLTNPAYREAFCHPARIGAPRVLACDPRNRP